MKEEKKKRYVIGVKVFRCWFYLTNLKMQPFDGCIFFDFDTAKESDTRRKKK